MTVEDDRDNSPLEEQVFHSLPSLFDTYFAIKESVCSSDKRAVLFVIYLHREVFPGEWTGVGLS
jgi:hypothetical protein